MSAKTTVYGQDILQLVFNGTAVTGLAQNATSSPLSNLYVSLHTAQPAGNSQASNEAAYTGYSRVAVARTSAGWAVTNNSVSPVANITFPAATGGGETETYFGVGASATGAGVLYYFGGLSPVVPVSASVQPVLLPGSTITEV